MPNLRTKFLTVLRVMRQQLAVLHKMLLDRVRDDLVCRRLMTAPGVALTYRATVDQPLRSVHSRAVGAHVGLRTASHSTSMGALLVSCGSISWPCSPEELHDRIQRWIERS
jgi:transposase